MGSYKQLFGMQTSIDRPDRVKPVPEHYDGENMPYRGTQTHGVKPTDGVDPEAHYDIQFQDDGPEDIRYMDPEAEPEPVPVRIVQKTARERLDWRPVRFRVTDTGQRILNRHEKRKSVRIKVHTLTDAVASGSIFIGNDAGVAPYSCYQLDAGEVLFPFDSTEDVWAICNTGETAEISIMYEFGVEL